MKRIISIVFALILVFVFAVPVSAQEYSTEYPGGYNSGSPLWLHCEINGMGEYVIVIDPNTNPQSFGFDSPSGYNLINNTGETIYGRAYSVDSSTAYSARWSSFYQLELRTGTNNYGTASYEAYSISKIYGTTLDLIDYVGNRDNDYYDGLSVDHRHLIIVLILGGLVVSLLNFFIFRRGHK